MELEAARRPDLAAGFLARFAEASDDFGLYGVLDFYLSYRAWVRGKVAAFVAADPTRGARRCATRKRERGAPRLRARALVLRARRSTRRSSSRSAGSSAAARARWRRRWDGRWRCRWSARIGRERRWPGWRATERGDAAPVHPEAVERNYGEVLSRARRGAGVRARRDPGRDLLGAALAGRRRRSWHADAGARFVFLEARCADEAVLRARLAARRGRPSVSDATDAELDEIQRRQEPIGADEAGLHASIDTGREPAHALASALRALVEAGVHPAAARRAS